MSTVLSSGWHRANKRHGCELCGRVIAVGERYRSSFQVDYGDSWTWRSCEHCEVYASLIFETDQWDEDYGLTSDAADEFEPRTWAEVRIKAMYHRRWRRLDGSLMPVPRLVYARVFYPRHAPWMPRFDSIAVACILPAIDPARAVA